MNKKVHYLGMAVHKDLRRLGSTEKNLPQAKVPSGETE